MSNRARARRGRRPITPEQVDRREVRRAGTYWNGEPARARKVRVRVSEPTIETWWFAGLGGTVRDAVEVDYGGAVRLLDDEDGSAWAKVTEGRGGPRWPHRDLEGVVVGERG